MVVAQMENGATVKSLNGYLKREPSAIWYSVYGKKGMMESDRWHDGVSRINVFKEGNELTDTEVSYKPKPRDESKLAQLTAGHGGSDFYTMHYFLEKILGRPEGDEYIDVYQALDMSLPGILAYKSICNGNIPFDVPDFRNKEIREQYLNDNWCTNPEVAGDNLAPFCSFGSPDIPDSVYESVRNDWEKKQREEDL